MTHKSNTPITPEDYAEPRCPLSGETYGSAPEILPVPQQRIIEKMDEYMGRFDYEGAERHLLYWLEEARLGHDKRGELMLRGELVGHYRKTGNKENAFAHAEAALRLVEELGFGETISAGTTYVNCATAMNAFGENARALELFEKAKQIYEANAGTEPQLLGGLYNNMALVLAGEKRFAEAHLLYDKAMDLMEKVPGGVLEQAITCLNRADAVEAEEGMIEGERRINGLLDRAYELLKDPSAPRNGYYAFVAEKCAPAFAYYGYFAAAEELDKAAKEIAAGN